MPLSRPAIEPLESRVLFAGTPMLPDLSPLSTHPTYSLRNWRFGTSPEWAFGRTLLRLSNSVANLGQGPLELAADQFVENPVSGTQLPVSQRVYESGGGYTSRSAGIMEFHDEGSHHHFHFEDFSQYNLRAVTAGNGVGDVVRTGEKAGFCLLDSLIANFSLPGTPPGPYYHECYPVSGISVGWADLYDYATDFQWIDVTGLAPGQYWLESIADPDDRLLEVSETNNTARILVTLNVPRLGDANLDGQVNHADFMALYANMNQSGRTWAQGDFTGDGRVRFDDFQVLELAFGQPAPAPTAVTPPPTSVTRPAARPAPSVLRPDDARVAAKVLS